MKILLSVQTSVQYCNSKYYNNSMSAFIRRYKQFCDNLVCVCNIDDVETPNGSLIEDTGVQFIATNKINSIKKMLLDEGKNEKIIEQAIAGVDACIIHVPSRLSSQVIQVAQKLRKPYMVVVVACPWDGLWNYDWRGKLIAPFSYLKLKREVRKANYALYVTQKFLQRRYPTKGKSIGCSDVQLFRNDDSVLLNKLERINNISPPNKPIILSTLAAVNVPYKGQEYVIRAIAALKEEELKYEYHLAGGGSQERLIALSESLGIKDQVIFYGSIPHDEVIKILDKTDIYIQPSKQEGLPRALVEAMSRACPAIASNIAGIPELLDDTYLFRKGDVKAIYNLLKSFTPQLMEVAARQNFNTAKLYEYSILENRRSEFLQNFISDIKVAK